MDQLGHIRVLRQELRVTRVPQPQIIGGDQSRATGQAQHYAEDAEGSGVDPRRPAILEEASDKASLPPLIPECWP